jgi:hypothetical protein
MRHRYNRCGPAGFFVILLFLTAATFATQFLWNWLIPELFHGPVVSFWQALGLLLLSKLLFGWHHHKGGPGGWGGHDRAQWKEKMKQRMDQMTPEQRAEFKSNFKNCIPPNRFSRWADDCFNDTKPDSSTEEKTDTPK